MARRSREVCGRRRPRAHPQWHLDEMYVAIGGRWMYLWRVIDQRGDRWTPRFATLTQSSPMVTKSRLLPGCDRSWLDEDQEISPTGPVSGDPGLQQSLRRVDPRSTSSPLVNAELVVQGDDLPLHAPPVDEDMLPRVHCVHDPDGTPTEFGLRLPRIR